MAEQIEQIEPIEDPVGEFFVNRQEELQLCRKWVGKIPRHHGNSYALIGRRRTGKTAILVRFFNQLFYEQDRVLPVYITFARYMWRKKVMSYYDFADEYFSSYLRSYLAFHYRRPMFVRQNYDWFFLWEFARDVNDEYALELCGHFERIRGADDMAAAHRLAQWVINFPRGYAGTRKMPTAIIVDEFQVLTDVYDPIQKIHHDLTDSFQQAVETRWAPLLVSGSAVSLLVSQALTGMLSGRFKYHYLKPLSREYAHDLVFRLGDFAGTPVTEEFAEAMYQITGGYPYTINAMMNSECPDRQDFPSLKALTEVMRFELTDQNGELWQHYYPEFEKYSQYLNTGPTTRRVMLWATKYPEQRIDADLVAQKLGMDLADVHGTLEKLRWADIVERIGLTSYKGPTDPMLRRFIEYQHAIEIEKLAPAEAAKNWKREYKQLEGRMNNFIGEVAEVYVEAVMGAFDGRRVDGTRYFSSPGDITLPVFKKIVRRGGIISKGIPLEIDLTGEWTGTGSDASSLTNAWLVQVKYTRQPIGKEDIRKFLDQNAKVISEKGYTNVTHWYFSKKGYTPDAARVLQQAGALYSTLDQFNALAKLVSFFGLPE